MFKIAMFNIVSFYLCSVKLNLIGMIILIMVFFLVFAAEDRTLSNLSQSDIYFYLFLVNDNVDKSFIVHFLLPFVSLS